MPSQPTIDDLDIVAMHAAPEATEVVMEEVTTTDVKKESIQTTDQQKEQSENESQSAVKTEEKNSVDVPVKSEEKDIVDAAITESQQQKSDNKEEGYESSDLSSSDDDDDDDNNDDDDDDDDDKEGNDVGDDEEGFSGPLRTKNELVHVIINAVDFEITPETELLPIGVIDKIIDNVVIVQSHPDTGDTVLDMGTLFAYEDRTNMGEVFETFGPVSRPYYSVRFNKVEDIDLEKAIVGTKVFYVPMYERTKLVPVEELRKKKYTDASNAFDEEISEGEIEFSDDEAELAHKQSKKKKNKKKNNRSKPEVSERTAPAPHKNKRSSISIPDDFDAALAQYEQTAVPGRQLQSYADISEEPTNQSQQSYQRPPGVPLPQHATIDPPWYMGQTYNTDNEQHHQRKKHKQKGKGRENPQEQPNELSQQLQQSLQQSQPQQQTSTNNAYKSPQDLVSSLLQSYGGNIPNLSASGQQQSNSQDSGSSIRSLFNTPPPSSKDSI
ncbi:Gar1/Naf1 RNA binding region-domain-containing protein [Circinella umbellata]|nr:Gar1/Naf1 RNA binding region-domain-containing protein [Circinella umbellata]